MSQCIRCYISGRVQGVWYRATAREAAERQGLSGYARNLEDGRVEVLACGDSKALGRFKQDLWEGSPAARVDAVECDLSDESPSPGFVVA